MALLSLCPLSGRAQVVRSYESYDRTAGDDYYATAVIDVEGAIGNSEFVDANFSGGLRLQRGLAVGALLPSLPAQTVQRRERPP